MAAFERSYLRLLLGEALAGIFQLLFEEICRSFRFLLAHLQVLADEKLGKLSRDFLGQTRVAAE